MTNKNIISRLKYLIGNLPTNHWTSKGWAKQAANELALEARDARLRITEINEAITILRGFNNEQIKLTRTN